MGQHVKNRNEFITEKKFTDERREQLAKKGIALPDGSFPIESLQDLKNAIKSYGRGKNKDKTKAHIIKRAKALNLIKELPEKWNVKE